MRSDSAPSATVPIGGSVLLRPDGLDELIVTLRQAGFAVKGPVVRDGAIVVGEVSSRADLPVGVRDEQSPGHYEIRHESDERLFGWAVGPGSWKAEFFTPAHEEWRAVPENGSFRFVEPDLEPVTVAVFGARPCELVALGTLDRVLRDGAYPDAGYAGRRDGAFIVVAECVTPAATCFCTSMSSGPGATQDFDLSLVELDDERGHRFLVRVGSARGADVITRVHWEPATEDDALARRRSLDRAASSMGRHLETDGLAALLARNIEHPRWDDVAERCLSCGNCTLVCPTCFCSDVRDATDLDGSVTRRRTWASCFDLDHSYLHGGAVRASAPSRYRQWLTHKLSTWWDQFDTLGCVGCGRCLTWCPVGIDITEEAAAIRARDGATRVDLHRKGAV